MRFLYFVSILLLTSCSQQSMPEGEYEIMDQSLIENFKVVEKLKIYFGHQSVGSNIIDGLADLVNQEEKFDINIIEIDDKKELPEFYFAHSRIGENTEPNAKCDSFSKLLNGEFAENLDIALMKFCYLDILAEGNPKSLFEYYKSAIDTIKAKHTNLKLVHVTIPLTTVQSGWKIPLKKLLGKEIFGYPENIKRFQFNEMLKNYYKNEPIFDLSNVESTYLDGSRESFSYDGNTYYALIPNYTYDGGHLNELGRQLAAKELVRVLAETINKSEK